MIVQTESMARYLAAEQHVLELVHFMSSAGASIGSFADAFHMTKLQAYRKVQRLLETGLLVIAAEQRRHGKPIKLYHCPHQSFFISSRVLGLSEFLEDQRYNAQISSALNLALDQLKIAGVLISVEPAGRVQILLVDMAYRPVDPHASTEAALVLNSGELRLDFEDAKALQHEIFTLLRSYHARHGSGRYQYQIILTPALA